MIRPEVAPIYDEIDLKLGIKSSLPAVKPTLALLILMWREMGRPSELEYSVASGNEIALRTDIMDVLFDKATQVVPGVNRASFETLVASNLMLKSQLEALIVAFELIWKVAKIRFTDGKPNSAERTGGARYTKKIWFTTNMDILDLVLSNDSDFDSILYSWLGCKITIDTEKESKLTKCLTTFSESAFYKLVDGNNDVIFNFESLYQTLLGSDEAVDVSGDKEAKGPLRILKSALTEDLFSNLKSTNNQVTAIDDGVLASYAARVATFHQLNPRVYNIIPDDTQSEDSTEDLRDKLMELENHAFIIACLDLMKEHNLFNAETLKILCDKDMCAEMFRHNSLAGILLMVSADIPEDEQRKDSTGNSRYYADKYDIKGQEYFVSSEWRPDRDDARTLFLDWIFRMLMDVKYYTGYVCDFSRNRILFGAPGTGKSFTLKKEALQLLANGGMSERVTFHPDYSYANFVGTYKPVPSIDSDGKDAITYSYVPGPFMRIYVKALKNSRELNPLPHLLIIEEINRANVAAVFGDVFQLLDRGDDEVSEYPIQASEDIKKYLASELGGDPEDYAEIRLPDNMFIWATMNSADQGVFPMDTAFKRRWDFTYLGIDDSQAGIVGKTVILGKGEYRRIVEWNALRKAINEELLTYKVNEDKLMGPYFISKKNLPEGDVIDPIEFTRIFKNKVIMYLFDDAAKQKRVTLFGGCDEKAKNQYSKICEEFDTKGVFIFCEDIRKKFIEIPEGTEE